MAKKELKERGVWQDYSGGHASAAEGNFYAVFTRLFEQSDFRIRPKPKELRNIYHDVQLSPEVLARIYNPSSDYTHGLVPDYAIDNTKTGKTLYVEVKRQDGWVEGKEPTAGRGNAHERSCKFFTPGLLRILREQGHTSPDALPFWVVFQGDIARDPKRVREVTCWYGPYSAHFFMWTDSSNSQLIIDHFNNKLRHLLT